MLRGDAQLIIVAGRLVHPCHVSLLNLVSASFAVQMTDDSDYSDTTSAALTYSLYELALHPDDVRKIRQELLDAGVDHVSSVQDQRLKHLKHLNGVINEVLRLHSSIPTALQRITPPGGMMIGDTFVPEQTTVWCPQYVMGRCKSSFKVVTGPFDT